MPTAFRKQFKGKCRNCGKIGHKSTDCWECPENKEKRPKNYRVSNMSDDKKRNDEKSRYFQKPGHKENVCFKKQCEVANHAEEESEDEYALITGVNIPKLFKDEYKRAIHMMTYG